MIMDPIRFVDTTIRDGHQSLWAENMTTGMMLPVAETMDHAVFDAHPGMVLQHAFSLKILDLAQLAAEAD